MGLSEIFFKMVDDFLASEHAHSGHMTDQKQPKKSIVLHSLIAERWAMVSTSCLLWLVMRSLFKVIKTAIVLCCNRFVLRLWLASPTIAAVPERVVLN